jgi:hypothetical protein
MQVYMATSKYCYQAASPSEASTRIEFQKIQHFVVTGANPICGNSASKAVAVEATEPTSQKKCQHKY